MNKEEHLRATQTFNTNYAKINDPIFQRSGIMDPRDLLLVRFELVRSLELDGKPIEEVCSQYGISPCTARRYVRDMKERGLIALVPEKRGPNGPSVMTDEIANYIDKYLTDHPKASAGKVYQSLVDAKKVTIGKRTVERYISSKKGKGGR